MAQGLKIRNANNEVIVDTSTSFCKVLGTFTTEKADGRVTVKTKNDFPDDTRIWVMMLHTYVDSKPNSSLTYGHNPTVYVDQNNMTISYEYVNVPINDRWKCDYLYGVY